MADSLQDSHDSNRSDSEKIRHTIELDSSFKASRVWLKLDLFLLPVIATIHLLSYLDRTNIGNTRIAGLQRDLQITDRQYSIALTLTYISNISAELSSNLLLRVIGPNYLLPALLISWGTATTLQGVVTSYGGLLACRFILGLCEGGAFPGVVLYLTYFYPRVKMTTRVSAFFTSASLSGAFSGILAYGIIRMDGIGGRAGWRWIFILEGAFTIAFGLISHFILPRDAMAVRFLRPAEREYVARQVAESGGEKFEWREVRKALVAPHVWIISILLFFAGAILFGLALQVFHFPSHLLDCVNIVRSFAPSIVQSLGYTAARAQLMSVPPFAAAFAFSMTTAYLCDKLPIRDLVCIVTSIMSLIGFIMFLTSSSADTRYGSLFFDHTCCVHRYSDIGVLELYQLGATRSSCDSNRCRVYGDERWRTFIDVVAGELEPCAQVRAWDQGDGSIQCLYAYGVCVMHRVFRVDESEEEEDAGTRG
ncbi:major facilitator superfamily domain-containing protein [Desarmillaria tabescens]|uniref:Major facilitator superfamily domain-containing protein n=1 Tax=Armillaria tabescens TaxID=1929756 RepID=A0AA39KAH1_ARMTA|nr:major facilitator superfamily domain-containing protein [Desarmillaria tabescens]KAK0457495.1 major facilitator superfamily domain-containing protein [Desarmillaria tabescens]